MFFLPQVIFWGLWEEQQLTMETVWTICTCTDLCLICCPSQRHQSDCCSRDERRLLRKEDKCEGKEREGEKEKERYSVFFHFLLTNWCEACLSVLLSSLVHQTLWNDIITTVAVFGCMLLWQQTIIKHKWSSQAWLTHTYMCHPQNVILMLDYIYMAPFLVYALPSHQWAWLCHLLVGVAPPPINGRGISWKVSLLLCFRWSPGLSWCRSWRIMQSGPKCPQKSPSVDGSQLPSLWAGVFSVGEVMKVPKTSHWKTKGRKHKGNVPASRTSTAGRTKRFQSGCFFVLRNFYI